MTPMSVRGARPVAFKLALLAVALAVAVPVARSSEAVLARLSVAKV